MSMSSATGFTIPKASETDVRNAPTRLRRIPLENLSGDVQQPTPHPAAPVESVSKVDPAQAQVQDEKGQKKKTYRKISQDLAKSNSEVLSAMKQIGNLLDHLELHGEDGSAHPNFNNSSNEHRDSIESINSTGSSNVMFADEMEIVRRQTIPDLAKTSSRGNDDLLGLTMSLTKATKKLSEKKQQLDTTIIVLEKKISNLEKERSEMLMQLESLARKLQQEKTSSATALTQLKVQYRDRLLAAEEELASTRAKIGFLQAANKTLQHGLEHTEIKLMEVPRLEESYLRTARGLVRQRDKIVNEKEVKIRSMAAEIEQVEFWKQKAQLYSEEKLRGEKEIAELSRQNLLIARQNLTLNQQLTSISKRKHNSSGNAYTINMSPPSPPDSPVESMGKLVARLENEERERDTYAAKDRGPKCKLALPEVKNTHSAPPPVSSNDEDFNAKEVKRLRKVVSEMNETIEKLHFKLAQARAYPLLHTVSTQADARTTETRYVGKVYVAEIDELMDYVPDDDQETAMDHSTAERIRMERALTIHRDFNTRLDLIRSKRPSSSIGKLHGKKNSGI